MLLKIIDVPSNNSEENGVKVIFEDDKEVIEYLIEGYYSPVSENFRKLVAWYYQVYPHANSSTQIDDKNVPEKLITRGQHIGDQLLGEDHQLMKIIERIETTGYQHLDIQLQSNRHEFFSEPWELCIFHESKYVLSSVSKSFTRYFITPSHHDYAEVHIQLHSHLPITNEIFDLTSKHAQELSEDEPLGILHIVTQPEASSAFEICMKMLNIEHAIHYEILPIHSLMCLESRLQDKSKPIHLVHYDTVARIENESPQCSVGVDEYVEASALIEVLVNAQIPLLTVNTIPSESDTGDSTLFLSMLAQIAEQLGLGNVIGLNQQVDHLISSQHFSLFFQKLTTGLSLAQAVIETRKALQIELDINKFTSKSLPFSYWPLLVHYGKQTVYYFDEGQATNPSLHEPQRLSQIKQKLLGFNQDMLPPKLSLIGEKNLIQLVQKNPELSSPIIVLGPNGEGKTHLLHCASFYWQYSGAIDYAFYFDFAHHTYTYQNMMEMIAPTINASIDDPDKVLKQLNTHTCCFVLDNLGDIATTYSTNSPEEWVLLNGWIKEISKKHRVLISGVTIDENVEGVFKTPLHYFTMNPLTRIEQQIFAIKILQQHKLIDQELDKNWEVFLDALKGSPFLIKKVIPVSPQTDMIKTKKYWSENINHNIVQQFYTWQWNKQPTAWHKLLVLCAKVDGLLLEKIMIVIDDKENFQPASDFLDLLGDMGGISFSEVIRRWEAAGFAKASAIGHIIDEKCKPFLHAMAETTDNKEALSLIFSKIICEGISRLTKIIIKKPNPEITHQLLVHRRSWVSHYEKLWFSGEYENFIKNKEIFDHLLKEAKLQGDSITWSSNLLERSTPPPNIIENNSANSAWLILAYQALNQHQKKWPKCLSSGEKNYSLWLDNLDEHSAEPPLTGHNDLLFFKKITDFLDLFHRQNKNWQSCIDINLKAYIIYSRTDVWLMAIASLKLLAIYTSNMNRLQDALMFENNIVNDIPYENSPPGFQIKTFIEIIISRLTRQQISEAKALYDQTVILNGTDMFLDALNNIHAEIQFQQKDYAAALPLLCKQWKTALLTKQKHHLEEIQEKLLTIEDKLGNEQFAETYNSEVGDEIVHPRDFSEKALQ